jgi:hypothetical protein
MHLWWIRKNNGSRVASLPGFLAAGVPIFIFTNLPHGAFYFRPLPFTHSRTLFLCRRPVLARPNFTPIKPPPTKAITAITIHSIAPPNVEFDNNPFGYPNPIFGTLY